MRKFLQFYFSVYRIPKKSLKVFLFISFVFYSGPLFSQNPLLLSNLMPIGNGRSIEKIVTTQSGNAFFNTIDVNNHFSNLWGLWVTDGTQAGTKKITLTSPPVPGGVNSFTTTEATQLTSIGNNKILFAGDDEGGYGEIWVSDGTQNGTFVLEQFYGSAFSGPPVQKIASLNNSGIYSVVTNDNKLQLHITDGSYAGTSLVYDFGDYYNYSLNYFKAVGSILYFEVNNNTSAHNEIWRTDGTQAGTYLVKDLGQDYGFASDFMSFNSNIYFITISSTYGDYIWKSDGTAGGTAPLKQISTTFNSDNLFPSYAATATALYFTANDGIYGKELWKADGTYTGLAADINSGSGSSNPSSLTVLNGQLYFAATTPAYGTELWKHDGTVVFPLKDIFPGTAGSNASNLTVQNNTLLFSASRSLDVGKEFWISDGSFANTFEIADVNPGSLSSNPSLITVAGNTAYFTANFDVNGDAVQDICLYKYTAPQKIWTGNVDNNWSDANNWFPSGSPGSTDDVLISSSVTNGPNNATGFINSLIINGGNFHVPGGNVVFVQGDFFNNGNVTTVSPGFINMVNFGAAKTQNVGSLGTYTGEFRQSSHTRLNLTTPLNINGEYHFESFDEQCDINNYSLSANNIFGGGVTNYFVTSGTGYLVLKNTGSAATLFPVGTSTTSYTPVTVTNNGTSDDIGVRVADAVLRNGSSGDAVKQQVVNKSWFVYEAVPGGSNANITLQWNAEDELPGFDRNTVYLNHYTSGAWDAGTQGTASGSDPFTFSRNGITSFSPFSVSSSDIILPITLLAFSAVLDNDNDVLLNWKTDHEVNTSSFTIERSIDGHNYTSVGTKAAYNSGGVHQYVFSDPSILSLNATVVYYRLKQIDIDGRFTYSRIIALRVNSDKVIVMVYPNPANTELGISLSSSATEKIKYQIIDMNGRVLKQGIEQFTIGANSFSIDVGKLPTGHYYVNLNGNSIHKQLQFVKK